MARTPENSDNSGKEDLLSLLQAHGQSFLSSFGALPQSTAQPKRKRRKLGHNASEELEKEKKEDEVTDEEWTGFSSEGSVSSEGRDSDDGDSGEMSDDGADEDLVDDDEFRSDQPSRKQPQVVVFSAPSRSERPNMSKLQAKSFMSSKVSKLREEVADTGDVEGGADEDEGDYEAERTNVQNDALLHKLVHTQLLSGSLDSELKLTPAQRRKALEGRVLELAAGAKLGKGESAVRQEDRKKASKKVRMGLERKVEERRDKALEEAKNLGNYHHSIKHLFEADSSGQPDRRKRDRGLKLGVGRFSGGILKLSKDDIVSVQGGGRPARGGTRGGTRGSTRGAGRGSRRR